MKRKEPKKLGPTGRPILVLDQDPVAKALLQKTFQPKVRNSKKKYDRKVERRNSRDRVEEL